MITFACKDIGIDCPFTAEGATKEEVMQKAAEHGMSVHNMSDADMTPEMKEKMMAALKEV